MSTVTRLRPARLEAYSARSARSTSEARSSSRFQAATPAETVTPLLPEGQRSEFTGGFTVKLRPGLAADFAYQYVRQNDRRGRTREPLFNQAATTGMSNGVYDFYAHLFGVSLGYAF